MRKTAELVKALITDITNHCNHEDIPENRTNDWPSECCAACNKIINAVLLTVGTHDTEALDEVKALLAAKAANPETK